MFKFDFKVETDDSAENDIFENVPTDRTDEENSASCYDSMEITATQDVLDNLDVYKVNSVEVEAGNIKLNHIKSGYLLHTLDKENSEDISKAEQSHSDLIPGVYEGGAKVWECTDDLLRYMSLNYPPDKLVNKRVLDLGCGAGILGIYAYVCEAEVHFQDYNQDVLERITIPNVILNFPEHENKEDNWKRVKFYSGDWSKYSDLTKDDQQFDFILTSETIYNPSNQQKLINTIFTKLKNDGIVLLAAKTYYFGVGGGLRQFEELIHKDERFETKIVWSSSEGLSREILEMRKVKE